MNYDTHEQLTIDHETLVTRGVYIILRDVDTNIRELGDIHNETAHRTDTRLTRLEEQIAGLKDEVTSFKVSEGITQHRISALEEEVKELRHDIKELHGNIREIVGGFSMMQTRLNWWLVIAGLVIATIQLWKG